MGGGGGVTKFSDTCIPPNKQIVSIEIRALERVEYFGHRFCFWLVEFPPPSSFHSRDWMRLNPRKKEQRLGSGWEWTLEQGLDNNTTPTLREPIRQIVPGNLPSLLFPLPLSSLVRFLQTIPVDLFIIHPTPGTTSGVSTKTPGSLGGGVDAGEGKRRTESILKGVVRIGGVFGEV